MPPFSKLVLILALSWAAGPLGASETGAASANGKEARQASQDAGPQVQTGESQRERRLRLQRENLRPVPEAAPADASEPSQVELPAELRERVIADAAQRSGVAEDAVKVISAQAVTWPDGSLGCPQPGTVYTQNLVPGYRIVVAVGEKTYDYRAPQKGGFQLCLPRAGVPRSESLPDDSRR